MAYQFWQRVFKDKHRLEHLKRVMEFEEMEPATLLMPKLEEEWCAFHHLLQSLLHMSLKCIQIYSISCTVSGHTFCLHLMVDSDILDSDIACFYLIFDAC
ncbi:hypothetical protein F3Y22_tig00110694pilonHSYRG00191 [Hibiscus syriacus]|uniref:Uncharacterized protein n=1 Tax=Hibiscus syriacus TaxID=106335 RepID=A0A6A2ZXS8_HIBSY|nr:hypothetical protein F3Y22_tig00110694pilonHSYRG00191 [Hibiscus syriacus]